VRSLRAVEPVITNNLFTKTSAAAEFALYQLHFLGTKINGQPEDDETIMTGCPFLILYKAVDYFFLTLTLSVTF